MQRAVRISVVLSLLAAGGAFAADGFYTRPGLFSTRPSETKSVQSIDRFGPVGIGIELHQPAFVMKVKNVEEGSPAAATGKLAPGQIIETINGQRLADIDPRIQLGNIITRAEASNGVITFVVKEDPNGKAEEVIVKIPVLGSYSKTWPLNCPKSDKIVRGFADYLAQPGADQGFSGIGMLFLLATGDDRDLPPVKQWVDGLAKKGAPTYAWHLGYGGIPLTEYCLRTGDKTALPTIQRWVDSAVAGQYLDGWAGRGGVAHVTYGGGGGHLNAGGTAVVTFLLLARQCGVNVPDHALHGALTHFYRWAGRGNNPYGDNRPEIGLVDNGKNGALAFAMAAAASLTPGGEASVYAGARDAAANTSFYTTTFMLHGHTGGGIGEIWRSAAMGLLYDKRPKQYREFMDNRMWHYELSRRFDGSFGILGGARYDNTEWGAGYALTYVIPRKTLQITGAPPSKFAKNYVLPERPWGTKADDAFASIGPAAFNDGTRPDFSDETLAEDSGRPLLVKFAQADLGDQTLRRYVHHPDFFVRRIAARKVLGMDTAYLGGGGGGGGGNIRRDLAEELFASQDARVRGAMLDAIRSRLSGEELTGFLGTEGFAALIEMLGNPRESWWIKDTALQLVARAPADRIVAHVDVILPYLEHKEWWLQNSALEALGLVVADPRCYQKVLPAIGKLLRTCERWNVTQPVRWGPLPDNIRNAGPEVRDLAAATLKQAYTDYMGVKTAPGGQDITKVYDSHMQFLAETLVKAPGGYDLLYKVAKEQFPNDPLPYAGIFLKADPDNFGPELRKAIGPIIRDKLIYEYIGENRRALLAETGATRQNSYVVGPLDGLVDLYRKVGMHDYDWRPFGPNLKDAEWRYFMFDPKERRKYDLSPWRYREVSYPAGMRHWFAPEFDAQKAGWEKGQAPFGQYNGKLVTDAAPCSNSDCAHADPMRTLWDKEVLLMRGTFKFPPLKPGHLYRIRVGNGQHVGSGDGYKIYINGKPLVETEVGVGRRQGGRPRGGFITRDFIKDFSEGEVTIAATSFLRYGGKAIATMPPVPQGIFSVWAEEMKVPPLDAEAMRKSAQFVPMLSSQWQAAQDPDNAELQGDDDRFRYDGEFVPNPDVLGSWTTVALVAAIDELDPAKPLGANRAPITAITLKENGATDDMLRIWSGDTLMDLTRNQALKMVARTIDGDPYLFIEAGDFSERNPAGWTSSWCVMQRK